MPRHPHKPFRAERRFIKENTANGPAVASGPSAVNAPKTGDESGEKRYQHLLQAIAALREEIRQISSKGSDSLAEEIRKQVEEAHALKQEIQGLYKLINNTKMEIASVRHPGAIEPDRIITAAGELSVVVGATEEAAHRILESVEKIDEIAGQIRSSTQDEHITHRLDEIAEQIVNVFEACNFQDLTGQRINKIIKTMQFIEDRFQNMINIWGEEDFSSIPIPESPKKEDNEDPEMHGPSEDGVSQADIDALFN